MSKINVLLVEDESVLATIIKETLDSRGFEIVIAGNGVEGWSLFNNKKPDLCIVDIMMPRKDGYALVQDIRKVDTLVPIIFLTAKTQTEDVLKGFEAGADDYMKKPFSMEELIMRLKSLARRNLKLSAAADQHTQKITTIGSFNFNYERLELIKENKIIILSQREADLMELLLQNKNRLTERGAALLKIWGDDNFFNARSMDVYITRLRKCFVEDKRIEILNIRGRGYKLTDK